MNEVQHILKNAMFKSIKQKPLHSSTVFSIPNFKNLGIVLRTLMCFVVLTFLYTTALAGIQNLKQFLLLFAETIGTLSTPLFISLLILLMLNTWLHRLAPKLAAVCIVSLAAVVGVGFAYLWPIEPAVSPINAAIWSIIGASFTLCYFDYHTRIFAPSLSEARLLALNARIRPHFLFNSLNAILGIMRTDLPRAEQAIEELSYLYRALMRENRSLVTLAQEVEICLHYLELERLRLGDRLLINIEDDECPIDALVPPLLLQPLIENAIYHGIEPSAVPSLLTVRFRQKGQEVLIDIINPMPSGQSAIHQSGNKMAMNNIRERLMLFFDLEAKLEIETTPSEYRVRIRIPYRTSGAHT